MVCMPAQGHGQQGTKRPCMAFGNARLCTASVQNSWDMFPPPLQKPHNSFPEAQTFKSQMEAIKVTGNRQSPTHTQTSAATLRKAQSRVLCGSRDIEMSVLIIHRGHLILNNLKQSTGGWGGYNEIHKVHPLSLSRFILSSFQGGTQGRTHGGGKSLI